MKLSLILFLILGSISGATLGQSARQPSHPGILLFQQGKFAEAVRSLEVATKASQFKNDAEIWNSLGLAYIATGEYKKSRKPIEKSVELRPSDADLRANLAYSYLVNRQLKKAREQADRAKQLDPKIPTSYQVLATANLWEGKLNLAQRQATTFVDLAPTYPSAYLLKSNTLVASFGASVQAGSAMKDEAGWLRQAVDTLELGVAKTKGISGSKALEEELESVSVFYKHVSKEPSRGVPSTLNKGEGVVPLKMLARPRAEYTDRARAALVTGAVRVLILFGASGKIEYVLFINRLGFGLDEQVLKAVRQIQFEPKKVNGKPVSSVLTIEYSFAIY